MAVFAILFGTRKIDASERHEGIVAAIAFEFVVKLVSFVAWACSPASWCSTASATSSRPRRGPAGALASCSTSGAVRRHRLDRS